MNLTLVACGKLCYFEQTVVNFTLDFYLTMVYTQKYKKTVFGLDKRHTVFFFFASFFFFMA